MKTVEATLVVQVAPYYPPHLGGVERTVEIIAEGLVASRYEVEVLTTDRGSNGAPRVVRTGDLTIRRLRALEIAHTPVAPGLFTKLVRHPRSCVVHVHVAQAFTPEVVWITSLLRRRPFVAHYHLDVGPSGPVGRLLPAYKRHLLGRVLRAAAVVIALSDEQATYLVEHYQCPRDRVVTIPNGVPPGLVSAPGSPAPASPWDPGRPFRVLFVGRISAQKNLPLLVEAVHAMAERAELVIVGDGPDRPGLARLVARLGMENIRLVGRVDHSQLASWYRSADVFALTSDREGMPLAALEAMSFGVPLVGADTPGVRELFDGVGVVVDGGVAEFAAALDALARDPEERCRLAARSLKRAASVDWNKSIGRIEALYARALGCR